MANNSVNHYTPPPPQPSPSPAHCSSSHRRQGITRVTVDEIVSGFRTLTGFSLTKEGIEDMTGRDLLPDNGNEGGDSIRALLRRAPGLTEDEDGLYSYTHDPQGIADALGDPSEIMGWRDMVMGCVICQAVLVLVIVVL